MSGDGAKIHGGRFNPKGTAALYLANTLAGGVLEAAHGFSHRIDPLILCSYELDVDDIVDLSTDAGRSAAGVGVDELNCPWLLLATAGKEPPSWKLANRLIKAGAAGILVPSYAIGATDDQRNLVLWTWGPNLPHKVSVYDPSGRLPKNSLSWS